jgi:hypothetical protein
MTLYEQLLEDLAAELAALDAVLEGITDTQRDLPIPSVPHPVDVGCACVRPNVRGDVGH